MKVQKIIQFIAVTNFLLILNVCYSQQIEKNIDSFNQLSQKAEKEIGKSNFENAGMLGNQAYAIANDLDYKEGIAKSLYLMGVASQGKTDFVSSLDYYLQSAIIFQSIKDSESLAQTYFKTGTLYHDWKAYSKAISYYNKANELYKSENKDQDYIRTEEKIGNAHFELKEYDSAVAKYLNNLTFYQNKKDENGELRAYRKLAFTEKEKGDYQKALGYYEKIIPILEKKGDKTGVGQTYNNIGYVYQHLGNSEKSLESFKEAIAFFETNENVNDPILLTNLGVANTNLKQFKEADNYFQSALEIYEGQQNAEGMAGSYNYLAANHYIASKNEFALDKAKKAVEIGEANNLEETLLESYEIISAIYERDEDYKMAQHYFKLNQQLKDKLAKEKQKEEEESLQNQLAVERKENEFKMLISEKEKQALALKQLKLESEKKEQELSILKRDQELQEANLKAEQLEKGRVATALEMAQQQLESEKKNQEIAALQKDKELKDLALKQKELEEKEKQKAIELLEADKIIKDQQLEQEATNNKYFMIGLGAIGIFALFVLYSLLQRNKANKLLTNQAKEIKEKNEELLASEEELRQNMEELESTQEALQEQKNTLEVLNTNLTGSIKYAKRIQTAILPNENVLHKVFPHHFVIFMPKDIVSGDFYWYTQVDGKSFIATVDCTGHGVPGAIMSVIGNSLLNQVVKERKIFDPGKILETVHHEVRDTLSQEDNKNVDGMDVSLCSIEEKKDGKIILNYSGAKNPLFIVKQNELMIIGAERKSVGGWQKSEEHEFETHEVELTPGDLIYLITDGIIDAPNENRERFGSKRFRSLLTECAGLEMADQKDKIMEAMISFTGSNAQRDDITLVGIEVSGKAKAVNPQIALNS